MWKNPYQTVQTAAFTSFSHCVFQTLRRTGKKHPAAPGKFSSPGEKSGRSCDPQARQRAQCYELCMNQGGVDPTPTPKPCEVHAHSWKRNVAQGDGGHTRRGDTGEVCTHTLLASCLLQNLLLDHTRGQFPQERSCTMRRLPFFFFLLQDKRVNSGVNHLYQQALSAVSHPPRHSALSHAGSTVPRKNAAWAKGLSQISNTSFKKPVYLTGASCQLLPARQTAYPLPDEWDEQLCLFPVKSAREPPRPCAPPPV